MNQITQNSAAVSGQNEFSTIPDFFQTYTRPPLQPQSQESTRTFPDTISSLEKNKETLIFAYLAANLNFKNLPLKAFMDSFEKKILLTCLGLTGGNQKKAAAVMGIKPTVLFEKMRKHGISRKQLRLSAAWGTSFPQKAE